MSQIWPIWNWATFLPAVCLKENPGRVYSHVSVFISTGFYTIISAGGGGVGDAVNMRDGPELSYFCYEANF